MAGLLHVLPHDGVGGAEIAARQAAQAAPDRVTVAVLAGAIHGPAQPNRISLNGFDSYDPLPALRVGVLARKYPVAIFSLWKSTLAMLATALISPGTLRVLLLHSDRRVHLPDRLATWLQARLAHEIWADCRRSLDGLGSLMPAGKPTRIISFVANRLTGTTRAAPRPRFIFWGRLTPLKRINVAIALFAELARTRPDARFMIIGPDDGSEAGLRNQVAALRLGDKVTFAGGKTMNEIAAIAADYDFFLQLSEQEGAAMSLIEAMQLGLAPIVTPVGEMGTYVRALETGVVYESRDQAAADIARILGDPALFARIGAAAVDHWRGARLY
ncbi:MAG: glycosyltransferase, partial [Acetobacteraceae bacterium]